MPKEREIESTAKVINQELSNYDHGQNHGVYGWTEEGVLTKVFGAVQVGDDVVASTYYGNQRVTGAKVLE